ncbi:MAG TPA: A/G-specific adenine glycosylase [Flavobacteriales bacterium]|nr:A/G-specific adenine glycosylase [Flavobacteriales bacterium]
MEFSDKLIDWYQGNKRDLPWRHTNDPYKVWLSEVILQQTRVAQGLSYYLKFERVFPTVFDLAAAPEELILKTWQGLGYYSRARNMHSTAKQIVDDFDGKFPNSYDELILLKGIGDYTASAIASFCFGKKHAVVDGNVFRVLSRVFGIDTPIDSTLGKKNFKTLAEELICSDRPAIFNQAMMEFGALQCTPKSPDCTSCPLNNTCVAYSLNQVNDLPKKSKKVKKRNRYFEYLVILTSDNTIIQQRKEKDIWAKLFEFPLIEYSEAPDPELVLADIGQFLKMDFSVVQKSMPIKHLLSHQNLFVRFWQLELEDPPCNDGFIKVEMHELEQFAFPKVVDNYLKEVTIGT